MKAITTKYHEPGNVRGSRMSATDGDLRITIAYDDGLNSDENHWAAAMAFARKREWSGTLARGSTKGADVFVWIDQDEIRTIRGQMGYILHEGPSRIWEVWKGARLVGTASRRQDAHRLMDAGAGS